MKIIKKLFEWKWLIAVFVISFLLFYPSLNSFFTHDDFYLLNISEAENVGEFINFFDLTQKYKGLGMYRPLSTQAFYFLGRSVFNLNPYPMHIISFVVFFIVIYLVYRFAFELTKDKRISMIATLLYSTSAAHFGQLYYLGAFQELGLALFFLISVLSYITYLKEKLSKYYIISIFAFIAALMSKETAVVLPFALMLVSIFKNYQLKKKVSLKRVWIKLIPFLLILSFYLFMRIVYYGFAEGESYIWDFSPRAINTLFWYGLWSLNLPEMLVDYVGSGLRLNSNLIKFWGNEIKPIFYSFYILLSILSVTVYLNIRKIKKFNFSIIAFSIIWFVITLVPVLFLPLHKFAFYLTLPLIGIVIPISYLLSRNKKGISLILLAVWIFLSYQTLSLTRKTHWISQGSSIAQKAYAYFNNLSGENEDKLKVRFYDTQEDADLPWSPSGMVKIVLSNNNFFEVFYGDKIELFESCGSGVVNIKAREFLPY